MIQLSVAWQFIVYTFFSVVSIVKEYGYPHQGSVSNGRANIHTN